jgi:hypothetical protein
LKHDLEDPLKYENHGDLEDPLKHENHCDLEDPYHSDPEDLLDYFDSPNAENITHFDGSDFSRY